MSEHNIIGFREVRVSRQAAAAFYFSTFSSRSGLQASQENHFWNSPNATANCERMSTVMTYQRFLCRMLKTTPPPSKQMHYHYPPKNIIFACNQQRTSLTPPHPPPSKQMHYPPKNISFVAINNARHWPPTPPPSKQMHYPPKTSSNQRHQLQERKVGKRTFGFLFFIRLI